MPRRGWALLVLVVGILLAFVSLFADPLGVGGEPGFGWKQTLGLVVGVALAAFGWWRTR
jgi:hypothetical protein